jgi:hypothetical protein
VEENAPRAASFASGARTCARATGERVCFTPRLSRFRVRHRPREGVGAGFLSSCGRAPVRDDRCPTATSPANGDCDWRWAEACHEQVRWDCASVCLALGSLQLNPKLPTVFSRSFGCVCALSGPWRSSRDLFANGP